MSDAILPFCRHQIFFRMTSRPLRLKGERRGSTSLPTFLQTHSLLCVQPTHSPASSSSNASSSSSASRFSIFGSRIVQSQSVSLLSVKGESSHHTQILHGIRPPVKIPQIRNSISSMIRKSLKSEFPVSIRGELWAWLRLQKEQPSKANSPFAPDLANPKDPKVFPQQHSFKKNINFPHQLQLLKVVNFIK